MKKGQYIFCPSFVKSDIKLTIGILVSNHIQYIRKAMESIKPILESIPSELIVVDTVGPEKSDGSLDVVKEYTDKVYHFDWINDFAAARNITLEHARGEWYMFFDDDEIFDDVTELIDFFKTGECYKYNFVQYYVLNYTNQGSQKDVVGRLVRRTETLRFTGIVHEYFTEAYGPTKQMNMFIHHYGYLFTTAEQFEAKNKRNLSLLEKEYEINGPTARICAQMIQQLMITAPFEAIKKCDEYLIALKDSDDLEKPIGQWLIVSKLRLMAMWSNLHTVLDCEKELKSKYNLSEMSRLVIDQRAAFVAFREQNHEVVVRKVQEYFELYEWLKQHEDQMTEQLMLDDSSFMTGVRLFETAKEGMVSESILGNFKKAYSYYKYLNFDDCTDFKEIRGIIDAILIGLDDPIATKEFYGMFYNDEIFEGSMMKKYIPLYNVQKN